MVLKRKIVPSYILAFGNVKSKDEFPFLNSGVFQESEDLYGYIVIKSIGPVTATKCRSIYTTIVDRGLYFKMLNTDLGEKVYNYILGACVVQKDPIEFVCLIWYKRIPLSLLCLILYNLVAG